MFDQPMKNDDGEKCRDDYVQGDRLKMFDYCGSDVGSKGGAERRTNETGTSSVG